MLAGRPPFTGESPVAIAYKQVNESPVPPSQINADVPPRLDAVVMRALSKNPANRYQTADDFAGDLDRVIKGQDVEATPLLPPGGDATQVISRPNPTAILPPPEEPKGSGRKVWLGVLIGVLIVAVLGGGGYLLVNALTKDTPGVTQMAMPKVTGMSFADAKTLLEQDGFTVNTPTYQETDRKPPGTVLKQSPADGAQVTPSDTKVDLVVAKAPTLVPVPDLTGLTLPAAQTKLDTAGLKIGTPTNAPSDLPVGQIFAQDPPANTQVKPGSFVDVQVSSGPAMVAVPDVTCLSLGQAKKALRDAGFLEQLSSTPAPTNPSCPNPERIASQDPAANTQLASGSPVTIFQGGASPTP
jgi:serine/threonine-protein kinase